MSAKDRFSYKLTCPKCKRTGQVDITESDGPRYFIQGKHDHSAKLTGPFTEKGQGDYWCVRCGMKATTG